MVGDGAAWRVEAGHSGKAELDRGTGFADLVGDEPKLAALAREKALPVAESRPGSNPTMRYRYGYCEGKELRWQRCPIREQGRSASHAGPGWARAAEGSCRHGAHAGQVPPLTWLLVGIVILSPICKEANIHHFAGDGEKKRRFYKRESMIQPPILVHFSTYTHEFFLFILQTDHGTVLCYFMLMT